jgi:RNA polymerase sigma-70 factor (ECF subfamily)
LAAALSPFYCGILVEGGLSNRVEGKGGLNGVRDVLDSTEKELIAAAREGDDDAFEQIVRRYEPVVAATVIGMLGRCTEAEDVGQETFIRLYRALKSFRGESTLKTYLTRIAINLSLNELKRRKRKLSLFSRKPVEEFHDLAAPGSGPGQNDSREIVQWAIQELDTKFRSVVVLRLIDGYSTEETARILGIPVGTVLSRLARAQEKLRGLLTAYSGVEP